MYICNAHPTKARTFNKLRNMPVSWSGDTLPICPYCQSSPYDPNWEVHHYQIEVNEHQKDVGYVNY